MSSNVQIRVEPRASGPAEPSGAAAPSGAARRPRLSHSPTRAGQPVTDRLPCGSRRAVQDAADPLGERRGSGRPAAVSLGAAHLPRGNAGKSGRAGRPRAEAAAILRSPWTVAWLGARPRRAAGPSASSPPQRRARRPRAAGRGPPGPGSGRVVQRPASSSASRASRGPPANSPSSSRWSSSGAPWTAVARAVAVGAVLLVQGCPRPRSSSTSRVAVLEVCAAVGVLALLPAGDIAEPATWLAYSSPSSSANVVGAAADRRRDHRHARAIPAGCSGPGCSCPSPWSARCRSSSGSRSCCWSTSPPGRGC